MRKFLVEMDSVVTLADLEQDFKDFAEKEFDGNFSQWLDECLGKNGALTEILTEDTPRDKVNSAVVNFHVTDADTGDEYWRWLPVGAVEFVW